MKPKFKLKVENLDRLFDYYVTQMTEAQKSTLPRDILSKMFTRTGKPISHKLDFYEMWFVMMRAMNKNVYVVIEDENHALGPEEFLRFKEGKKQKDINPEEDAAAIMDAGMFVIGNNELCNMVAKINAVSVGPAFNYLTKIRSKNKKQYPDLLKEFEYLAKFLSWYESNKKRMVRETGITVSDLYILIYLFDGQEKKAVGAYMDLFAGAIAASKQQLLKSFKKLAQDGLVVKSGPADKGRHVRFRITTLGRQKFFELVPKYILP